MKYQRQSSRASRHPPAPRFELRVPIAYRAPETRGKGVIWDISKSGARIEIASATLTPGMKVRVKFAYASGKPPVLAWAQVVRQTDTGFAVRFVDLGELTENLLTTVLPEAAAGKPLH